MNLPVQKIKFAFAISLSLLGGTPVQAQTANPLNFVQRPPINSGGQLNKSLIFAVPPPPPDIGEPGQRYDAGSRGCENLDKQIAPSKEKRLTALVPVYSGSELVLGATTLEHPTFWFYVPYTSPLTGKFVLRDKDGKSVVYKADVTLPAKPGVVSLSLPSTVEPLEIGKQYHWYFKIYCNAQQPPGFVDGWIQRNSVNTVLKGQLARATQRQRVALYAANGFWHEALTAASDLHRTDPQNSDWVRLLRSVGLGDIAPQDGRVLQAWKLIPSD